MSESATVRWGILGTARIATKVGAAIRQAEAAELTCIASRSAERAAAWADEHGARRSIGNYEAVLDDPEIDAIYIPLPPSMHREWTLAAAQKGKHVLCEKPLAASTADAAEMADACREHGVQLMDGVMWLHHPRAAAMLTPLREGALGDLRRVTSAFTFHWDEIPANEFRLHRSYGGGSLLDLGWYCAGASLWALGKMPTRVFGTGRFRDEVDMNFSAMMWYEDEQMASFDCGFDTEMRRWMEIAGSRASLICDDFTRPWNEDKPRFWIHDRTGKADEHTAPGPIQEVCMIEDFCRIIRSGELEDHWPRIAVQTQQICEALDRSARSETIIKM